MNDAITVRFYLPRGRRFLLAGAFFSLPLLGFSAQPVSAPSGTPPTLPNFVTPATPPTPPPDNPSATPTPAAPPLVPPAPPASAPAAAPGTPTLPELPPLTPGPAPAPPEAPAAPSSPTTPAAPAAPAVPAAPSANPGEAPSLPSFAPGAEMGNPTLSPTDRQAIKQELFELQALTEQLQKRISTLAQKLDGVPNSPQIAPPPTLPSQPGGPTSPGLITGNAAGPGSAPGAGPGGGAANGAPPPGAPPGAPGAEAGGGAPPPKLADLKYPITKFILSYAPPGQKPNPKLPPLPKLEETKVELGQTSTGYSAPKPPKKSVKVKNFNGPIKDLDEEDETKIYNGEALQSIYTALFNEMNHRGFYGILVLPDPADIDATTGEDLRKDRKELKVNIYPSTIREVRTVSKQVKPGQNAVDTPDLKWIAATSPLKAGSLLQKPPLQSYLSGLNSFPGRRVDAAINSVGDPNDPTGIVLDYIVRQEAKPYYLYTQASNTGTEETGDWRLRTGFEYRNLIGHDDVLNGDYIFSPDGKSQSVLGSYSRALLPPDKLKLRIYANWGTFTASDVGFDLQNFDGESWTVGAALTICPFKIKGVPINLFVGTEWRNVSVVNHTFPQTGDTNFFVPYVGFSFQQTTDRYSFAGTAQFEHNFPDIAGTSQAEMDKLGRFGTTPDFTVAKWSGAFSTYLEPLVFGPKWKDGSTWWKSTLAHEIAFTAHGQYAFDHVRLIPQFEDVIGGFTSVRGYPESLTAGDTTVIGSLEYRIHLPRLLKPADKVAQDKAKAAGTTDSTTAADIPPPKFSLRPTAVGSAFGRPDWDFIIRGFLDAGLTYNDHRIPSAEANEELAGTGVGVELQVSRYVDIRVDWGIALLPEEDFLVHPVHRGDSRFNFLFSLLW